MTSKPYIIAVVIVLCLVTAFSGCRNKKKMQRTTDAASTVDSLSARCRLDFKSARTLGRHMTENEFKFDWVNAKANVESNFDEKEESFDIRVSMRRDSAILISI